MLSIFRPIWVHTPLEFPRFTGSRIMMMPVLLGNTAGVPEKYQELYLQLCSMVENRFIGEVGYLTIDEKEFTEDSTHRREGWHVDGYHKGRCGAWGGGGGWGSVGNGMIVVSNVVGCEAVAGNYPFTIGDEGEASLINWEGEEINIAGAVPTTLFKAGVPYWVDGGCVHRSTVQKAGTKRQFVRLSMPNNGAWFEGYTENPTGIKQTGEVLPERTEFMKQ